VLTPASRYADPFVQHVTSDLVIVQGRGGFGRQVADGAVTLAHALGREVVRLGPDDDQDRPTHRGSGQAPNRLRPLGG
jgi:hypothetical protein